MRGVEQSVAKMQPDFHYLHMANKRITLCIEESALANLEKVADADHMDATKFGALVLSKLSDLAPGRGLDAISAIPKDYFRKRPGRPSAAAAGTNNRNEAITAQDPLENPQAVEMV